MLLSSSSLLKSLPRFLGSKGRYRDANPSHVVCFNALIVKLSSDGKISSILREGDIDVSLHLSLLKNVAIMEKASIAVMHEPYALDKSIEKLNEEFNNRKGGAVLVIRYDAATHSVSLEHSDYIVPFSHPLEGSIVLPIEDSSLDKTRRYYSIEGAKKVKLGRHPFTYYNDETRRYELKLNYFMEKSKEDLSPIDLMFTLIQKLYGISNIDLYLEESDYRYIMNFMKGWLIAYNKCGDDEYSLKKTLGMIEFNYMPRIVEDGKMQSGYLYFHKDKKNKNDDQKPKSKKKTKKKSK